ncbi:hypothetical protein NHQ30_005427 [Ciborinia camelliae]|nr:hypothetical protein NHQ30_005427 [Ciborinia camelliae]
MVIQGLKLLMWNPFLGQFPSLREGYESLSKGSSATTLRRFMKWHSSTERREADSPQKAMLHQAAIRILINIDLLLAGIPEASYGIQKQESIECYRAEFRSILLWKPVRFDYWGQFQSLSPDLMKSIELLSEFGPSHHERCIQKDIRGMHKIVSNASPENPDSDNWDNAMLFFMQEGARKGGN